MLGGRSENVDSRGYSLKELRIGLIGSGFMGQAHADAFRRARLLFPALASRPVLAMIADRDEPTAKAAAERFGIPRWTGDWRKLIDDSISMSST